MSNKVESDHGCEKFLNEYMNIFFSSPVVGDLLQTLKHTLIRYKINTGSWYSRGYLSPIQPTQTLSDKVNSLMPSAIRFGCRAVWQRVDTLSSLSCSFVLFLGSLRGVAAHCLLGEQCHECCSDRLICKAVWTLGSRPFIEMISFLTF